MKLIILSCAIALISASSINLNSNLNEKWEEFKLEYNKVYQFSEEAMRKEIFAKNLEDVDSHNKRFLAGEETYEKGINQFSDMTYEEFAKEYLGEMLRLSDQVNDEDGYIEKPLLRQLAPDTYSWQDTAVQIKNQGSCGSCWAFASTASVEYRYKRLFNQSYTLAEQELVDCERKSHGCSGGWSDLALNYVRDNGINYESNYPYKARDQECHVDNNQEKSPVKVKNVCSTPKDEVAYKDHFYQYGPLVVYYFVDNNFKQYKSGIFSSKDCNAEEGNINHAVLIIGYGNEKEKNYWLVRNSWGEKFGEKGYFRILRDAKMCNLGLHHAYYPEVV